MENLVDKIKHLEEKVQNILWLKEKIKLEKWIDVSVLDFSLRWADTNSRGFEPATLVAGPAALTY